jgi:hypothetical protein
MGSGRVQNLGEGLVSATSNGSLQNSTASQVRTLLDIDGVYQFLPVFKPNGGLGNSAIRMGKTPSNFFAIGYGLSNNSAPIYAHHQFGDLVTLHVDGGTAQFGYNTYSSLESSSGAWSYPKINTALGASKMVQGADGSITFRTLQPNETPTQWEAALTMRGDRKVGIGTEQPEEKLHVVGNIFAENVRLSGNATNPLTTGWVFRDDNQWLTTKTNTQVLTDLGLSTLTNGTPFKMAKYNASGALGEAVMQEDANGNVILGNLTSTTMTVPNNGVRLFFEGAKPIPGEGALNPQNSDPLFIERANYQHDRSGLRINLGDDGGPDKADFGYYKHDNSGWYNAVSIYANGELWAKKVKVTTNAFDDYVFAPNYKLPTLKETEEFIQRNGHLPDVPCAEEVIENGLDLTQINRALLKKVEEMTLHLIRMEKEIEELKSKK